MAAYSQKVSEIINSAERLHRAYYEVKTFGGPSLHFHRQSLKNWDATEFPRRLEYIYATLAAWGMHRMGKGGSKMLPFDDFQRSMVSLKDRISEAAKIKPSEMTENDWSNIEAVFRGIRVMASGTSILGNSKVMAHLLPNLFPPIDREYTLRYLRGTTSIAKDIDKEWQLMKDIIAGFFIPVSLDKGFQAAAKVWMADQDDYPWDTSIFKIIDNLVIGVRKLAASKKSRKQRNKAPTKTAR